MPLFRRLPKRGFTNATLAKDYAVVNVGDLESFDDGATVDMAALKRKRLASEPSTASASSATANSPRS